MNDRTEMNNDPMTGYVMAPTPPQIADHIERWNKLDTTGVEGLPPYPLEYLTADTGEWIGSFMTKASAWRHFGGQSTPRLGYRLVPLPSLPPSPETVVVVDANTAHALIGRSIGGQKIVSMSIEGEWCIWWAHGQYIHTCKLGEPVSLDPLPAPPPEEEVETVTVRKAVTVELPITEAAWWASHAGLTADHHVVIRDACLAALTALTAVGGE